MSTSTNAGTSTTRHAVVDTAIGQLTLVGDDGGLTGVYFPQHWTNPDRTAFGPHAEDDLFDTTARQLAEYLAGDRRRFDLPLNPHGTPRAREIWGLIAAIPYGGTTTYGALAERAGGGISARAIGGFVGHNPLSIVVGCHRVVGSTGKLTGYAGGLERKQRLLELEGALPGPAEPLW